MKLSYHDKPLGHVSNMYCRGCTELKRNRYTTSLLYLEVNSLKRHTVTYKNLIKDEKIIENSYHSIIYTRKAVKSRVHYPGTHNVLMRAFLEEAPNLN